ncbi:MAG: inosine monophosphate cyclohydrolase [Ruminococcaceae bacterium]|nr:inosine monophosphate cyclohydrolase [Oscillospiraceae bacterium]
MKFSEYLKDNAYPGRGVAIGRSADGTKAILCYFIMGRSTGSRNRVFEEDGAGIRTRAFDESKLPDPSLYVYRAVRVIGDQTVVTNGDQTDTIYDALAEGKTFEDALRTRTFEPDPPIWTPRISGVLTAADGKMSYKLSILKNGGDETPLRYFYEYEMPRAGEAHIIHTYAHDGDPVPSFSGEPVLIDTTSYHCANCVMRDLWEGLNADNKVSAFVRTVDLTTGETVTVIKNKHEEK